MLIWRQNRGEEAHDLRNASQPVLQARLFAASLIYAAVREQQYLKLIGL